MSDLFLYINYEREKFRVLVGKILSSQKVKVKSFAEQLSW